MVTGASTTAARSRSCRRARCCASTARFSERSEPEQPIDLEDQRPVGQTGETGTQRVTLLAVDKEQLASRLILPAQPYVGGDEVIAGVVLKEGADEHPWRHRIAAETKGTRNNVAFMSGMPYQAGTS